MFVLHTQLAKDCVFIGDLPLSRVLMMNDTSYPWLVLVPRRAEIVELFQLPQAEQQQLLDEISAVSKALAEHFHADKMNIAALGNMVPQLHVHVIVRYRDDAAWPRPVWGAQPAQLYGDDALRNCIAELAELLAPIGVQRAAI